MLWNSFNRDREILENQYSPKKYNENSGLDIKTVLENAKEIDSGILPDAIKRAEIIKCIFTQRVQRSLKELFLSVSRRLCDKAFFANTYNNKVFLQRHAQCKKHLTQGKSPFYSARINMARRLVKTQKNIKGTTKPFRYVF